MSLVSELNASNSRVVDCVRLAAVWVAHIDHDFSDDEEQLILARLPDRQGGMPLQKIVAYVREAIDGTDDVDLPAVFTHIRETLAPQSRASLLSLVCEIVAADGRISVGERHALAFLADLVGLDSTLPEIFYRETGLNWTPPPDLSDENYWEALERAQRNSKNKHSSERDTGDKRHENEQPDQKADPSRVEALATLGLVGNPSRDEIKAAYRRLAKVHHPDRFHGLDTEAIQHATRNFQRIQRAFELLSR
jgi:uncharacterized tellurite resistance protein B-like protein